MEEWVGVQWHRIITRAADGKARTGAVQLADMQRSIGLLFRAGGGAPAVRMAPANTVRVGGRRNWLQRVAGSATHAHLGQWQEDVLALPPSIAVFEERSLNRALYLWLAALAAQMQTVRDQAAQSQHQSPTPPPSDWLAEQIAASQAALQAFPGLQASYATLCAAQLAQRPAIKQLRGRAALAEQAVQQALRGQPLPANRPLDLSPADIAPLWLWLSPAPVHSEGGRKAKEQQGDASGAPKNLSANDKRRRAAKAIRDERNDAPFMMMFRAESFMSWTEFTKVNRADDDEDDGKQLAAANNMDELAIAADGQSSASRVKFDLDLPSAAHDDLPLGEGIKYPEWDYKMGQLRPNHCNVQIYIARDAPPYRPPPALRLIAWRMRRRLEALRAHQGWLRGQSDGDEIDMDAWLRHQIAQGPRDSAPPIYMRRAKTERSLATLLLADLSLSTDAYATEEARVIDVIRDALHVFGEALSASGDPFAMLGFSSVRRNKVRLHHLKGFAEEWSATTMARVNAIKPGYYTRMGAAIRHATAQLEERVENQRLLLILTDGKPNDLDVYEGRYGLEDTRQAVREARTAGLTPFCVTIDVEGHDYLPHLFGTQGYALVHRPQDLVHRLAAAYAGLTR